MKKHKIVITGGHHNSALVVARLLRAKGHLVYWFGHRHASSLDAHDSAEYLEVTAAGFPFYNLCAGKLGSSVTLGDLLNFPRGFFQAGKLLRRLRPDGILSFGGYLGFTTCLVGYCFRLPLFLHEQTAVPGKSNLLISRLAKRLYLTWESSLKFYPSSKSLVTGLPLRTCFTTAKKKTHFSRRPLPTLLILGGKQGSHTLNELIFSHLPEIIRHYNVIHQTGTFSATADNIKSLSLKKSLPIDLSPFYRPRSYLGENEIAEILKNVDLYIGRSGAHITYELGILGKKAILIPYPFTHRHEQLVHARILERAGNGLIIPQSKLSFPLLKQAITRLLPLKSPLPLDLPVTASETLVADLLANL